MAKPKRTLTRSEYLSLLGIKTLADRHNASLEDLLDAAQAIMQDTEENGPVADVVLGGRDLDDALLELGVTVEVTH